MSIKILIKGNISDYGGGAEVSTVAFYTGDKRSDPWRDHFLWCMKMVKIKWKDTGVDQNVKRWNIKSYFIEIS